MKKRTKGVIAIIGGLAITATVMACGHHHRAPEERANYMVEKVSEELSLNETQVAQLEKLKMEFLGLRQEFRSKREQTHATIEELLAQPTLDQQRVLQLVRNHTDSINEKAPAVVSSVAAFYDSLSAEQQAEIREKMAEHREHKRHWHHW